MRGENTAKSALNAVKSPKFEVMAEDDRGNRFTVPFKVDVILCMHRYVVTKTRPYTVLGDNSIYLEILNRTAIQVTQ